MQVIQVLLSVLHFLGLCIGLGSLITGAVFLISGKWTEDSWIGWLSLGMFAVNAFANLFLMSTIACCGPGFPRWLRLNQVLTFVLLLLNVGSGSAQTTNYFSKATKAEHFVVIILLASTWTTVLLMLITFLLYFKVRRVTAESADRQPIIHYRTTAHNRDGESTTPKRLYNATDDITTILNVDSVRDINSSYPRPTASRQDNMTGNIGILARPARARTDGESTTPKRLYNATDDVTTIHFVDSDRDINRSYPRPTASSWEDNTAGRVPAQPESSRRIGNDVTTTRIVDSDRDINRSYPRPTASSWEDNTGSRRVPAQPESSRRNGNDVTTVDTDRDINRPTTSTREDNMTSSMRISARPSSSRRIGSDVTATSWRDAASRWFSRRRVEDDGSQRDRRPQRPRSSNKQTVGFSSRESSPNHPTAKLLRPKSGAK